MKEIDQDYKMDDLIIKYLRQIVQRKPYQFRRFASADYVCAVGRYYTVFLRIYSADIEAERPSGSLTEVRICVGIFLLRQYELGYLLAKINKAELKRGQVRRSRDELSSNDGFSKEHYVF